MPDLKKVTGSPLGKAVTQKIRGEKPGAFRAMAGAAMAGVATSVLVYKLLRQ
jgi:hypothetical protein